MQDGNKIPMPSSLLSASMRKAVNKWSGRQVYGGYYKEAPITRKDGEIWTDEEGYEWQMKDGIKYKISKLESARIPLFCPQCKVMMNKKLDDKFYILRNKCFDCCIKEEQKMRIDGTWEEYEKNIIKNNKRHYLTEYLSELNQYFNNVKDLKPKPIEFANSDGTTEKWDSDRLAFITFIESEIKATEEALEKLDVNNV